jgi:hypothetical protein
MNRVIYSKLPNNPGGSITNSAEVIAGGDRSQRATYSFGMDRALAQGEYGRGGDVRAGHLLQLRGYGEGTLPWGDQGMDRDATWKGLDRATVEILSDGKALEGFLVEN